MYFLRLALNLSVGKPIQLDDLKQILSSLDFGEIKQSHLPNQATIIGKPSERKKAIFQIAENFWGLTATDWLNLEADWQTQARKSITAVSCCLSTC